jgi:hypothetical protein
MIRELIMFMSYMNMFQSHENEIKMVGDPHEKEERRRGI